MKKLTITAVLVIALIATLAFNETILSKANSDPLPLPAFNISELLPKFRTGS